MFGIFMHDYRYNNVYCLTDDPLFTYMTKKNPIAIKITPASFMPAKLAPYNTISNAKTEQARYYQLLINSPEIACARLNNLRSLRDLSFKIFTRRYWNARD